MRRVLSFILIFLAIILISGNAIGQSAKDAIEALKKLQSRVSTGISYKDYITGLGETDYAVKSFINSPEASQQTELTKVLQKIMSHYRYAGTIWALRFERSAAIIGVNGNLIDRNSKVGNQIVQDYPAIGMHSNFPKFYDIPTVLSVIWQEASKEIEKATRLAILKTGKESQNLQKTVTNIEGELDKIDDLKKKGKISDEEYKKLRKSVIERK